MCNELKKLSGCNELKRNLVCVVDKEESGGYSWLREIRWF